MDLVYQPPVSQKFFLLLHFFLVLLLFLLLCYNFSLSVERWIHCAVFVAGGTLWVWLCVCTDGEARGLCQVSSLTASETRSLTELSAHWLARTAGLQLQRFACLYPSSRTGVVDVDAHWPHLASLCRCWDLDSGNTLYDTLLTEPSPSLLIYFWSIIVNNLQTAASVHLSLLSFSSEKQPLQLRDKQSHILFCY